MDSCLRRNDNLLVFGYRE